MVASPTAAPPAHTFLSRAFYDDRRFSFPPAIRSFLSFRMSFFHVVKPRLPLGSPPGIVLFFFLPLVGDIDFPLCPSSLFCAFFYTFFLAPAPPISMAVTIIFCTYNGFHPLRSHLSSISRPGDLLTAFFLPVHSLRSAPPQNDPARRLITRIFALPACLLSSNRVQFDSVSSC